MISLELTRLHVAVLLYALFILLLLLTKPSFMFTPDGHLKKWGMENDAETNMFAFGFVVPLMGILLYILATWMDMILYKP